LDLWYLFVRKDEKIAAALSVLRRFHQDEKTTIMTLGENTHQTTCAKSKGGRGKQQQRLQRQQQQQQQQQWTH